MTRILLACVLVLVATAPAPADEDALAEVQGKWQRLAKDAQGRTVRYEKEHRGHKTILSGYDEGGRVAYSHTSEFELSRAGPVKVFTYFNLAVAGKPAAQAEKDRRSYIYKVEGDQFVEAHGLLIGQDREEPFMVIWERMKP